MVPRGYIFLLCLHIGLPLDANFYTCSKQLAQKTWINSPEQYCRFSLVLLWKNLIIFTSLLGFNQMVWSRRRRSRVYLLICVWMMTPTCRGRSRSRWAGWRGKFTEPTGLLVAECWPPPSWCLCSSCKVWTDRSAFQRDLCTVMSLSRCSRAFEAHHIVILIFQLK